MGLNHPHRLPGFHTNPHPEIAPNYLSWRFLVRFQQIYDENPPNPIAQMRGLTSNSKFVIFLPKVYYLASLFIVCSHS